MSSTSRCVLPVDEEREAAELIAECLRILGQPLRIRLLLRLQSGPVFRSFDSSAWKLRRGERSHGRETPVADRREAEDLIPGADT